MQAADPWERVTSCWRKARFSITNWRPQRMAEKSVGRIATRRRSIEPGRIQALGEIVNRSGPGGVLASNRAPVDVTDALK